MQAKKIISINDTIGRFFLNLNIKGIVLKILNKIFSEIPIIFLTWKSCESKSQSYTGETVTENENNSKNNLIIP